jgi:AmmeMemoRadiSam system protein B
VAALVFAAIKRQRERVDTFVIFGAAHGYYGTSAAVYDKGGWLTPLGEAVIDEELAAAIVEGGSAVADIIAHQREHSIEVQVPFIQQMFAEAKIVPVLTPPSEWAISVGEVVGELMSKEKEKSIICIGSTDLTHYGPRYGFSPMGLGEQGLKWATDVNDKKFIDLAVALEPEKLLASAAENCNACGAGAAAATIAAMKKLGKSQGVLLDHTNSNEIMLAKMGRTSAESVGYAAIVF